jgi:hypothetical protein
MVCTEWKGARQKNGYGRAYDVVSKRTVLAHRLAWEDAHGPIPEGMCVLHRCDNRACVKVAHLFLGTRADNTRDMHDKGRGRKDYNHAESCRHGHAYPENAYYDSNGWAHCRVCDAERHRRARRESRVS